MIEGGFWPEDLQGWLWALGQVAVAAGAAWKLAMVQVDQRIRETEDRIVKQVNGLGGRVRFTETGLTTVEERSRSTEADLRVLRDRTEKDMREVAEKWGRLDERTRNRPTTGGDTWGGPNPP